MSRQGMRTFSTEFKEQAVLREFGNSGIRELHGITGN